MNWLVLVIVATFLDAARIFADNYISDYYFKGREAVAQKLFYGYAYLAVSIVILLFFVAEIASANIVSILILIAAGFMHGISGIPYFRALELDNSTNIGIFIQLAPVLYLILGWLFLGESFTPLQLVAIGVIMLAPILIVVTAKKRSRKVRMRAVFYAFLYVLIAVVSNLIFVQVDGGGMSLVPEIAFVLAGKGIADLLIVYSRPKLYRRYKYVVKESRRKIYGPMFVDQMICITKEFLYRAALVAAPAVAVASAASDSVLPIVIFFMGIVLSIIWPRIGREKLNRKTVAVHLIATVLAVVGIVLLQF